MPFLGAGSYSRFEEIALELPERVAGVAERGAEKVADGARERVTVRTGRLHDAIHVEKSEEVGEFLVVAGDKKAWYGHIVEHGSVHAPARPFLMPAAEAVRDEFAELGRAALVDL